MCNISIYQINVKLIILTVVLDRLRDRGFGTGTWPECVSSRDSVDSAVGGSVARGSVCDSS